MLPVRAVTQLLVANLERGRQSLIQELVAMLALRHTGQPPPTTIGKLVGWFLRKFSDCPPVHLRLGPREGFRLPSGGLILDGDATDKQEPDVLLLISEQPLA
jgi:hypothetical protein